MKESKRALWISRVASSIELESTLRGARATRTRADHGLILFTFVPSHAFSFDEEQSEAHRRTSSSRSLLPASVSAGKRMLPRSWVRARNREQQQFPNERCPLGRMVKSSWVVPSAVSAQRVVLSARSGPKNKEHKVTNKEAHYRQHLHRQDPLLP